MLSVYDEPRLLPLTVLDGPHPRQPVCHKRPLKGRHACRLHFEFVGAGVIAVWLCGAGVVYLWSTAQPRLVSQPGVLFHACSGYCTHACMSMIPWLIAARSINSLLWRQSASSMTSCMQARCLAGTA